MSEYHYTRTLGLPMDEAETRVTEALADEGFGVLTEIDVQATLKKKLDVDFRAYKILGACNPELAHRALELEDKIGTMLPCNVVLQSAEGGGVEVSAVDPVASMQAVGNDRLVSVAREVRTRLRRAIDNV